MEPFTRNEDQRVRVGRAQGWLCQILAIHRIRQYKLFSQCCQCKILRDNVSYQAEVRSVACAGWWLNTSSSSKGSGDNRKWAAPSYSCHLPPPAALFPETECLSPKGQQDVGLLSRPQTVRAFRKGQSWQTHAVSPFPAAYNVTVQSQPPTVYFIKVSCLGWHSYYKHKCFIMTNLPPRCAEQLPWATHKMSPWTEMNGWNLFRLCVRNHCPAQVSCWDQAVYVLWVWPGSKKVLREDNLTLTLVLCFVFPFSSRELVSG